MTRENRDLRYERTAYVECFGVRLCAQASATPTSIGLQNNLQ